MLTVLSKVEFVVLPILEVLVLWKLVFILAIVEVVNVIIPKKFKVECCIMAQSNWLRNILYYSKNEK